MVQERYFKELRTHAPLSKDSERELLERLRRRRNSHDRSLLITSNLRFVVSVASHYRGFGVPFEDLVNEGNLGLIEAAERFDPNRGIRFVTYATWWVRKTILRAVAERSIVRIPPYRHMQIRKARERSKQASDNIAVHSASQDLEQELSHAVEALDDLLRTTPRDMYLNDAFGPDNDRPVDDLIADDRIESAEFRLIRDQDGELIQKAMQVLTPSEWKVIRGRFGLDGKASMTLKQIAVEMGISRERVRQIEIRAKERLRRMILNLKSKPYRVKSKPHSVRTRSKAARSDH